MLPFLLFNLLLWVHMWLQKPSFFFKWRSHFYKHFFFFSFHTSEVPYSTWSSRITTNNFSPPSAQANTDDPVLLISQYSTEKSICFCSFLSPLSTWIGMPWAHFRNARSISYRVDWRTWAVQFTNSLKKANRDSPWPSVMHSFAKWFFPKKTTEKKCKRTTLPPVSQITLLLESF